ncbi:hypothetical protein SVAN01_06697 [Stagonosporopsis vannaccii]|nr:hypothetical protein SVAN01_06697 [Stagonosporopsis vannaccii]
MQSLFDEISRLRSEVQALTARVAQLQAENIALRPFLHSASANALTLPAVIEKLVVLRRHFSQQGTLRHCSAPGCSKPAFDPICFRLNHMAWCRTHNRIMTRNYTTEIQTEERPDWLIIVARAYQNYQIGLQPLAPGVLQAALFPPGT